MDVGRRQELEERARQVAAADQEDDDHRRDLERANRDVDRPAGALAGDEGDHGQERDDGEVLKQKDREAGLAGRAL